MYHFTNESKSPSISRSNSFDNLINEQEFKILTYDYIKQREYIGSLLIEIEKLKLEVKKEKDKYILLEDKLKNKLDNSYELSNLIKDNNNRIDYDDINDIFFYKPLKNITQKLFDTKELLHDTNLSLHNTKESLHNTSKSLNNSDDMFTRQQTIKSLGNINDNILPKDIESIEDVDYY